ncbi:hypothetical protein [Nocardiopsis alborubida]|uniref:Uncharacterized protein n=1 Tax=Nocardiopsis alborubida TaxID=146802 RepID=A0A7X6RNX4_9ACTN|nr:hypothetical protein [Nocardiopsis alborubida]NKY96592.1 hypothetical protein [Nocardiopsis alborubida]
MDDEDKGGEKRPGLIDRIKRIYVERPIVFALVVMGGSAVALVVGGFLVGDLGASTTLAPGPMSP